MQQRTGRRISAARRCSWQSRSRSAIAHPLWLVPARRWRPRSGVADDIRTISPLRPTGRPGLDRGRGRDRGAARPVGSAGCVTAVARRRARERGQPHRRHGRPGGDGRGHLRARLRVASAAPSPCPRSQCAARSWAFSSSTGRRLASTSATAVPISWVLRSALLAATALDGQGRGCVDRAAAVRRAPDRRHRDRSRPPPPDGKPLLAGDRSHVYDQLADRGWPIVRVLFVCAALQVAASAAGLLSWHSTRPAPRRWLRCA